jgi:hypothetical protein
MGPRRNSVRVLLCANLGKVKKPEPAIYEFSGL